MTQGPLEKLRELTTSRKVTLEDDTNLISVEQRYPSRREIEASTGREVIGWS